MVKALNRTAREKARAQQLLSIYLACPGRADFVRSARAVMKISKKAARKAWNALEVAYSAGLSDGFTDGMRACEHKS